MIDQPFVRSACASTQFSHVNIGTGPFDGLQLWTSRSVEGLRHRSRNSDGVSPSGEVDLARVGRFKRAGAVARSVRQDELERDGERRDPRDEKAEPGRAR